MANPTTIYGLPAPLLSGQADGPDALQDLNDKLEVTLGNMVRPFTQVISDVSINTPSGSSTISLTAVPLGRPVVLFVNLNCRILSSSFNQYGVYQIFEGVTKVTGDVAAGVASGSNSLIAPVMLTACRTFSVAPSLVISVGGAAEQVISDNIRATGFGFAWPS